MPLMQISGPLGDNIWRENMKICFMENLLNCGVNKSKINDPIRLILFSYFQPKFWKILLEILFVFLHFQQISLTIK